MWNESVVIGVRTGDKDGSGSHIKGHVDFGPPSEWSEEFLRYVLDAGPRSWVAEKLNDHPTDGGAKYRAAKEHAEVIRRGEMPVALRASRPQKTSTDPVKAEMFNLFKDWAEDALRAKAARDQVRGSGKGGRIVAADFAGIAKGGTLEDVFTDGTMDLDRVIAKADELDAAGKTCFRKDAEAEVERKRKVEEATADLDI